MKRCPIRAVDCDGSRDGHMVDLSGEVFWNGGRRDDGRGPDGQIHMMTTQEKKK